MRGRSRVSHAFTENRVYRKPVVVGCGGIRGMIYGSFQRAEIGTESCSLVLVRLYYTPSFPTRIRVPLGATLREPNDSEKKHIQVRNWSVSEAALCLLIVGRWYVPTGRNSKTNHRLVSLAGQRFLYWPTYKDFSVRKI